MHHCNAMATREGGREGGRERETLRCAALAGAHRLLHVLHQLLELSERSCNMV